VPIPGFAIADVLLYGHKTIYEAAASSRMNRGGQRIAKGKLRRMSQPEATEETAILSLCEETKKNCLIELYEPSPEPIRPVRELAVFALSRTFSLQKGFITVPNNLVYKLVIHLL